MSRCGTLLALLRRPEPVVVVHQLAGALFDTALLMVVKDRCANATTAGGSVSSSGDNEQQKAMSDFYMKYNLIMKFVPIVPALLLAWLGDRGWRKAPVLSPLLGYLLSRLALLLVVVLRAPLELMFAGAALYGLTGGFCSFWAGIQTLVSLGSAASRRSKAMMTVELLYGLAALLGSLASGHLFQLHSSGVARGTILVGISIALYLTCLLHVAFLLQVKQVSDSEQDEGRGLIADGTAGVSVEAPRGNNWLNVALLFAGGVLYDVAVGGAMQILVIFEVKEPLSWNATQVGYGNAAGYLIFLTSFFGVMLLSRWLSDVSLVLLGMLSFASGIFFMSFVTTTSMFYLARSLTLFALIPVPTIRSLLSQQVQGSSYGVTLLSLELAFKLAGLAYTPSYTRIYQTSLDWFPGFVFMLSSIITVLGTVPISVLGCRLPQQRRYQRIQGD